MRLTLGGCVSPWSGATAFLAPKRRARGRGGHHSRRGGRSQRGFAVSEIGTTFLAVVRHVGDGVIPPFRNLDSRRALLQHVVHALGEGVRSDGFLPPRVRLLERDVLRKHRVQPLDPRRDAIAERREERVRILLELLGGLWARRGCSGFVEGQRMVRKRKAQKGRRHASAAARHTRKGRRVSRHASVGRARVHRLGSRAKSIVVSFSNARRRDASTRDAAYLDEPVRAEVVVHERGDLALRHRACARRRGLVPARRHRAC